MISRSPRRGMFRIANPPSAHQQTGITSTGLGGNPPRPFGVCHSISRRKAQTAPDLLSRNEIRIKDTTLQEGPNRIKAPAATSPSKCQETVPQHTIHQTQHSQAQARLRARLRPATTSHWLSWTKNPHRSPTHMRMGLHSKGRTRQAHQIGFTVLQTHKRLTLASLGQDINGESQTPRLRSVIAHRMALRLRRRIFFLASCLPPMLLRKEQQQECTCSFKG